METALLQVAIQVPAIIVLGYVFLQVLRMVMDVQGQKLDRMTVILEATTQTLKDVLALLQAARGRQ